jgi:hypothetical protein
METTVRYANGDTVLYEHLKLSPVEEIGESFVIIQTCPVSTPEGIVRSERSSFS